MKKTNVSNTFEEIRENVRGIYELWPAADENEVTATSEFYLCNRMIFSHFSFSPFHFDRDPKKLKDFNTEYLLLERYISGEGRGIVAECLMYIDPGTLHLVDWSRHQRSITTSVAGESFMIPHDLVGYDPSRHPAYFSLKANSAGGYLLNTVFDQFYMAVRNCRMDEAATCAELCVSLVRRVVHGKENNDADGANSRVDAARVRSFIRRELANPLMNPDRICGELNISRATLYRLFAEEGGVVRYIDRLRLQNCFGQLFDASRTRGEVRRIAEAWGYYDAATFNRKFRRQFNITPSDCLGSGRSTMNGKLNKREIWPINNWLKNA